MPQPTTRLVLFDMDGTLIDSAAGIFASLDHAFAHIGALLPSREELRKWIGPPFQQTFPGILGGDLERVELAIEKYREHYTQTGWSDHSVYPGSKECVAALVERGCLLGVVTTKPLEQARKIVEHLPFGSRFTACMVRT